MTQRRLPALAGRTAERRTLPGLEGEVWKTLTEGISLQVREARTKSSEALDLHVDEKGALLGAGLYLIN